MPALSQSIVDVLTEIETFFSVTDDQVFGDGITDVTDGINETINRLNLLGEPATFYLPTGHYILAGQLIDFDPDQIQVVGDGRGTIIEQTADGFGNFFKMNGRYSAVTDLVLTNSATPSDEWCIQMNNNDWKIENVDFIEVAGILETTTPGSRGQFNNVYGRIMDESPTSSWFKLRSGTGGKWTNFHINGGYNTTPTGAYIDMTNEHLIDGPYFSNFQCFSEPAVAIGVTQVNGQQIVSTVASTVTVDSTASLTTPGSVEVGPPGRTFTVSFTGLTPTTLTNATIDSGVRTIEDNADVHQYVDGVNGKFGAKEFGFLIDGEGAGFSKNNLFADNFCIDGTVTAAYKIKVDSNTNANRVMNFINGRSEVADGRIVDLTCVSGGSFTTQSISWNHCRFVYGNGDSTARPFTVNGPNNEVTEVAFTDNTISEKSGAAARASVFGMFCNRFKIEGNIFGCTAIGASALSANHWVETLADSENFQLGPNTGLPPAQSDKYSHFAYTAKKENRVVLGQATAKLPYTEGVRIASVPQSSAVTAQFDTLVEECVVQEFNTYTGIRYSIGGVANGGVVPMIYDYAGNLLYSGAEVAQSGANGLDQLPFTLLAHLNPGIYWMALQFSGATATFNSSRLLCLTRRITAGSMAALATIAPPVATPTTQMPAMRLY